MRNELILKNNQLDVLVSAMDYKMPLSIGRARQRFLDVIKGRVIQNEKFRIEILEKYSLKDDKGNPIIDKTTNKYQLAPEHLEKVNKETSKLFNEIYIVDVLPSLQQDIPTIIKMLENSTIEMNLNDTVIYTQVIDAFNLLNLPPAVENTVKGKL